MKPAIDINHPLSKIAIKELIEYIEVALDLPQTVESAVIPIYGVGKRKGHQKPKTKPEQMGSGVLINIKDQYFIFGATHVFLEYGAQRVLTGGQAEPVQDLAGERFSTGKQDSPSKDSYDASVFHIQSNLSDSLKKIAITPEYFDLSLSAESKPIYFACGFRVKKSNTSGDQVNTKREVFPSFEFDNEDYKHRGIDPQTQLALVYGNQLLVNGDWRTAPRPRGFSGGAIIKIDGTDLFDIKKRKQNLKQSLVAITTEHHKDKNGQPGMLLSTRITVHLWLIKQFMPNLINDIDLF